MNGLKRDWGEDCPWRQKTGEKKVADRRFKKKKKKKESEKKVGKWWKQHIGETWNLNIWRHKKAKVNHYVPYTKKLLKMCDTVNPEDTGWVR